MRVHNSRKIHEKFTKTECSEFASGRKSASAIRLTVFLNGVYYSTLCVILYVTLYVILYYHVDYSTVCYGRAAAYWILST